MTPITENEAYTIIRSFIEKLGIDPKTVESQKDHRSVAWRMRFGECEVMIMLYEVGTEGDKGEFIWIQGVLARLDRVSAREVMSYLLKENFEFSHPFKFALNPDGDAVILLFRSSLEWLSKEHLEYRLNELSDFFDEMSERLRRRFNLRAMTSGQHVMKK